MVGFGQTEDTSGVGTPGSFGPMGGWEAFQDWRKAYTGGAGQVEMPELARQWLAANWADPGLNPYRSGAVPQLDLAQRDAPAWFTPVAGATLDGRQPLTAWTGGTGTGTTATGTGTTTGTTQNTGSLLSQLFNPAMHANLAFPGMANATNKGKDWPVGGVNAAPIVPQGLGTPVNVRAARLASQARRAGQAMTPQEQAMWDLVASQNSV